MEEEVNEKVVSIVISGVKLSASILARALAKVIADDKARSAAKAQAKANTPKTGKMTLDELNRQNAGAVSIEINDGNIKSFDRVARKYGIDYAVKKDGSCDPPKYFVFFKARDQDTMTMAFKEFVKENEKRQNRTSFKERLNAYKEKAKSLYQDMTKVKYKDRSRAL
ncbi:MAG: PcfB family protein [Acetatifactor sp.]|nr:PcfB family protein [Acetatifactor sp.]